MEHHAKAEKGSLELSGDMSSEGQMLGQRAGGGSVSASAHRLTQRLAGMGRRPARLLRRTGGQSAGTSRVNSSGNHGWSLNSNFRDLWRIWRRRTPLEILLPLHRIRFVFYNVLGRGERGIAGHKWFHRGKGKGYQGLFLPL